jgi:hypothetical protein
MTGRSTRDEGVASAVLASGPVAVRQPPYVRRPGILIGYARCSTERQDLTAQRQILQELGVAEDRVYLDHGLTGRNRSRPGLNSGDSSSFGGDSGGGGVWRYCERSAGCAGTHCQIAEPKPRVKRPNSLQAVGFWVTVG